MAKPKVLISDELSPRAVEVFAERGCDVDFKPGLKPAELRAIVGNYEGLAIRSATKVTAEVLADTVTLVLPASEDQVLDAMRRLRLWPLLDGYRGRAKADMAAVAKIAVTLGAAMLADQSLEEIEINPILVRPQGAVAVDALIRKV